MKTNNSFCKVPIFGVSLIMVMGWSWLCSGNSLQAEDLFYGGRVPPIYSATLAKQPKAVFKVMGSKGLSNGGSDFDKAQENENQKAGKEICQLMYVRLTPGVTMNFQITNKKKSMETVWNSTINVFSLRGKPEKRYSYIFLQYLSDGEIKEIRYKHSRETVVEGGVMHTFVLEQVLDLGVADLKSYKYAYPRLKEMLKPDKVKYRLYSGPGDDVANAYKAEGVLTNETRDELRKLVLKAYSKTALY